MDLPGTRYKILATRCRQSAAKLQKSQEQAALLRMARSYERRALEVAGEWDSQRQELPAAVE
jgi:hypothetical protein